MHLSPECLEQLKCFLCKRLLSRFPIYVTKARNTQLLSICGRCKVPSNNYLRNTIYENVTKNVQFPCINRQNGCMEYLLPENIEQHELLCQYQTIKCKICEWSGQFFTVLDHYQSKHADLILKNYKFKMNIKHSNISNILLHKDAIFCLERNIDQTMKRLKCTLTPLFSTRNVKKYYVQINLMIDDITMFKKFPEIDTDKNESKTIDVNIENMSNDDSTKIIGIINITNDIKELSIRKQYKENLSKLMYNVDTDVLCTSVTKFDTNLQSSSNHLLNLTYQTCQYGCGYTTISASDLKQHNNSCLNKPYNCLFIYNENNQLRSCEELISLVELGVHIENQHRSDIELLTNSLTLTIEIGRLARERYCKYLTDDRDNDFILIVEYIEPNLLLWRVEVLKSKKTINNYTFEIMFIKHEKPELLLTASCAELTCNRNYNINDTPCLWLHLEQIKRFIKKNTLSFNISVYDDNETKILCSRVSLLMKR